MDKVNLGQSCEGTSGAGGGSSSWRRRRQSGDGDSNTVGSGGSGSCQASPSPRSSRSSSSSIFDAFRRRSKSDSKHPESSKHSCHGTSGSSSAGGSKSTKASSLMSNLRSHIPWSDRRSTSVSEPISEKSTSNSNKPAQIRLPNLPNNHRVDPYFTYTYGEHPSNRSGSNRHRSSSGSSSVLRVMDIFTRNKSGDPLPDPFGMSNHTPSGRRSIDFGDLAGENENLVFVKFFKLHRCYDLIPVSAKLIVFDTQLLVKKAFHALVSNGMYGTLTSCLIILVYRCSFLLFHFNHNCLFVIMS